MRLIDKPSKLPPKMAVERFDKLQKARQMGKNWKELYGKRAGQPKPEKPPPPLVPVSLADRAKMWAERGELDEVEMEDGKIKYEVGRGGDSLEKMAFFNKDVDAEMGEPLDWSGAEVTEDLPGMEPGRIVEVRR
jgi:hypothetical protein